MTIHEEGLDSKILRWSGFAIAAFILSALAIGGPEITITAPAPTLSQAQVNQPGLTTSKTYVMPEGV